MEITMEMIKLFLAFTLVNMIFTIIIVVYWKSDKKSNGTFKTINDLFDVQSSRLDILSDRISQCVNRQNESSKFLDKAITEASSLIGNLGKNEGKSFYIDQDGIKIDGDLERNVAYINKWKRNVKVEKILKNVQKYFKEKGLYPNVSSTDDILTIVPHNTFVKHCEKSYNRINAKKYYRKLKRSSKKS